MKALYDKLMAALQSVPAGVRTLIVHMLTGKDNITFDIGRVLLLLPGLTFIGLAIHHAVARR